MKNIEITITDDKISKIVCTQAGVNENPDTLVTIDGVGTTVITLPKIKEATSCVTYKISSNQTHAEVTGYSPKTEDDLDVLIADTYQNKPVTVIKSNSFSGKGVKSVVIPDSVTTIEGNAFSSCKILAKITIPDSVTDVGYNAFGNTAWFDSQADGAVYAGKVAYQLKDGKMQTKSVSFKEGTVSIAPAAFYEREYLTEVFIPGSVKSIGKK